MEDFQMAKYNALHYHHRNARRKYAKEQRKKFFDSAGKAGKRMMTTFAMLHL